MQHIFISAFCCFFFSFCLINCIIIAIINKYISQSPFLSAIIKFFIIYCMHCSAKTKANKSYDQIRISTVWLPCTLIEQIALNITKLFCSYTTNGSSIQINHAIWRNYLKHLNLSVVVLRCRSFLFIIATKAICMAFRMYIIHKFLHMTLKSDCIR